MSEPTPDEDTELRAIEANYAVSHRVIASRVQKFRRIAEDKALVQEMLMRALYWDEFSEIPINCSKLPISKGT